MEVAHQVREWVEEKDISIPKPTRLIPISNGSFDDDGNPCPVTVQDLSPMFGYPYLYQVKRNLSVIPEFYRSIQHANDCEHLVAFIDIRMSDTCDPQDPQQFPLLTCKPNPRRVVCKICNLHSAKVRNIFSVF